MCRHKYACAHACTYIYMYINACRYLFSEFSTENAYSSPA